MRHQSSDICTGSVHLPVTSAVWRWACADGKESRGAVGFFSGKGMTFYFLYCSLEEFKCL